MYMEEIFSEEIKNETSKLLKLLGVKHAVKKLDHRLRPEKKVELYHVFKTSLELLEKDAVTLAQSSAPVEVPVFIIDTCEFIKKNVKIEGLFRKAGSTSKQRELRATLDCGNRLEQDADHQVINVANILKLFFRELPEPLIPFNLHDLFLRCLTLKENKIEAILLGCLLLPTEHLNTLAYLMQFLNLIAMNSEFNKMDVGNLSIIFTPSIMPVSAPKLTPHGGERINHHVQIIRILIENAGMIGLVPEVICEKLGINPVPSGCETEDIEIKKPRNKRSGSLTRMLSGLKKIMSKHSIEGIQNATPSEQKIYTPKIMSSKKRKTEAVLLSAKKKREVIKSLPQGLTLANTLYTPHKPKNTGMLSPRTLLTQVAVEKNEALTQSSNETNSITEVLTMTSFVEPTNSRVCDSKESLSFGQCTDRLETLTNSSKNCNGYICIPKAELEAIKSKVEEIENIIDVELEYIIGLQINKFESTSNEELHKKDNCIESVQCAYTQTVEQSEKLNSSASEHLTRKLSKELKIRHSSSQRMIRSPSARKIGTIRRRSKDNFNSHREISRHLSLNACDLSSNSNKRSLYPSRSLRRGKPNTVYSGLHQPSMITHQSINGANTIECPSSTANVNVRIDKPKFRASFFNETISRNALEKIPVSPECDSWNIGKDYFDENENHDHVKETSRDSIAKLRMNVGMVLAKAKIFESARKECQGNTSTMIEECHPTEKCCSQTLKKTLLSSPQPSLNLHTAELKNIKNYGSNKASLSHDEKENHPDFSRCIRSDINNRDIETRQSMIGSPLKSVNRNDSKIKHSLSFRTPIKKYHKDCIKNTSSVVTARRSPRFMSKNIHSMNLPVLKK